MLILIVGIIGFRSNLDNLTETTYNISFITLFFHNTILSLVNVLGMFTLGLSNLFFLFVNAFDLGNILNYSIGKNGFIESMRIFVPHAVFELPSMIISLSIGMFPLSFFILKAIGNKSSKLSFIYCVKRITLLFAIVLLLNFFAALMESFVSV